MDRQPTRLHWIFRNQECFIFLGLWLWLAIFKVLTTPDRVWIQYFQYILLLSPIFILIFAFYVFKPYINNTYHRKVYIRAWLGCFVVLLPTLTLILATFVDNDNAVLLATSSVCAFTLELTLGVNHYYQRKVRHYKWIKKLGLEHAVLISLVLIAVTLSAMAVSSLDNPVYHKEAQLLIGFEFSLEKLFIHFWLFLSFFFQFLIMYLCGYLFFVINSKFLVSKILKRYGLITYLLFVFSTTAIAYPFVAQLLKVLPINKVFGSDIFSSNPFDLENAFGALSIMLISLPIVVSMQWIKQNSKIVSLEKEKARTELDLLKLQLNPHFFFNTLNNLYALSIQQSEKTPESILQLSELMRYTIYKGQADTATLEQELKYLNDYIQLQQIRLKHSLTLTWHKTVSNDEQLLSPMLFMVLVENAFKHGIEPAEEQAFLNLTISADARSILFVCQNSFEEGPISEHGGIGLTNLRKRLSLLYPNRHELKIECEKHIFTATLNIDLT